MVGYGLSKTAAHHYVQTMGSITELALISKSQRKQAKQSRSLNEALDEMTVVGILPTKIDTPSNRKSEPDADFGTWTKPEHIAKEIGVWMDEPHLRPHSGSLVKVYATADGGAKFQLAR
jgi:dihydropteridine reductase